MTQSIFKILNFSQRCVTMKWVPFSVAFERTLQFLAVLIYIGFFLFITVFGTAILIYLLMYTNYWWITIAYVVWMYLDKDVVETGGRPQKYWYVTFNKKNKNKNKMMKTMRFCSFLRSFFLFKHYVNFFPIKLIKTANFDPCQNYLMVAHPHGVRCLGLFGAFASDALDFMKMFPGIFPRLLTVPIQFKLPLSRELLMATGACVASKDGINAILR